MQINQSADFTCFEIYRQCILFLDCMTNSNCILLINMISFFAVKSDCYNTYVHVCKPYMILRVLLVLAKKIYCIVIYKVNYLCSFSTGYLVYILFEIS